MTTKQLLLQEGSLPVDSNIGMYYQYYRGTQVVVILREIFFNFDTTWKDVSLQERRWTTVTGGAPATIVDYVPSKTHGRRLPVFQNSNETRCKRS